MPGRRGGTSDGAGVASSCGFSPVEAGGRRRRTTRARGPASARCRGRARPGGGSRPVRARPDPRSGPCRLRHGWERSLGERRGLPRTEGHAAGETALLDVVNGALEIGIKWITFYAFSTENWRRPPDEVRYLMGFNQSLLMRRRDELNEKGVQIRFAGRRDWRVPRRVLRRMDESIELTRHNRRMVMTMAFNYGGRAEIVDAVRSIVAEGMPAGRIDEKTIARHLYYPDMPDPDLVIRTSGETRISNFLLWEIAYSELVFPETLWPDMRRASPLRGRHRVPAPCPPLRRRRKRDRPAFQADGDPSLGPDQPRQAATMVGS